MRLPGRNPGFVCFRFVMGPSVLAYFNCDEAEDWAMARTPASAESPDVCKPPGPRVPKTPLLSSWQVAHFKHKILAVLLVAETFDCGVRRFSENGGNRSCHGD